MKRLVALFIALNLSCLLVACADNKAPEWSEAYSIVGLEDNQMWDLKADSFLPLINETIENDAMVLSYLHELDDFESSNCMLTKDGESWKILLSIFSVGDSEKRKYQKVEDAKSWVGNIEEVELSLYSDGEDTAKENRVYVRNLIRVFTPGAEELVEEAIGLYGKPYKDAVLMDGVNRVTVGGVVYTYMESQHRFIVQPHLDSWPTEENAPNIIRPN